MTKYRIVKTPRSMKTSIFNEKESYWYKLEKKTFLTGWTIIGSGYFGTDYEAEQSLKPEKIIAEFEK